MIIKMILMKLITIIRIILMMITIIMSKLPSCKSHLVYNGDGDDGDDDDFQKSFNILQSIHFLFCVT